MAAIVKLTAPTVGARIDAVLMAEDAVAQESDSEEVASDDQSAPLRPITSSVSHGKNEISSSSSPSHERSDTHASGVKDASDLMSMIQSAMTVQK